MAEETYLDPSLLEMDPATWDAIQRGKDLTQDINRPLNRKERNLIQGPTDLDALDEPDFGPDPNKPKPDPNAGITSSQEEFDDMRSAWEMGQDLEAMKLSVKGWQSLRHIVSEKIKELRNEQDAYKGFDRDKIVDLSFRLRHFQEAYDFLFGTVEELIHLSKPKLLQPEEK